MIRFLHTADLQLGAPFARFPAELAARLREARIGIIDRLGALAHREGAAHVLVAGDVFDNEQPSAQTLRQPLDAMAAAPVTWWLLPGNHDPARPHLVWDRVAQNCPKNVRPLTTPEAAPMEPGVHLLPAPWTTRFPGQDLTAPFDRMPTPPDAHRIGIAHGSTTDFAGDARDRALIAKDRARTARLDYLALGDWHGTVKVDDRTFYSGTPEPDRFRNNDAGNALLVEIDAPGALPRVTPHRVATFDWRLADAVALDGMDLESVFESAITGPAAPRHTLLQLSLSGRISAATRGLIDQYAEDVAARLAHLDLRLDGLQTRLVPDDLSALPDPLLRQAAERLAAAAADGEAGASASRALDLLFSFSATDPA